MSEAEAYCNSKPGCPMTQKPISNGFILRKLLSYCLAASFSVFPFSDEMNKMKKPEDDLIAISSVLIEMLLYPKGQNHFVNGGSPGGR